MTETKVNPIRLFARKKKDDQPYTFTVSEQHWMVLDTLDIIPGLSDRELTFLTEKHMIASARCRVRDAGLIEQCGANSYGMTWQLTQAGRDFLNKNGDKR